MSGKSKNGKAAFTRRERFQYWFDNRMARGFLSLIRTLIIASALLALLMAVLIVVFRFDSGELGPTIWDSIAMLLNAEVPDSDGHAPGYIVLMAVTGIAGILFTSVLIGIITSAIEEKLLELKSGNSRVLEEGHIVILGFYPGEYTLLRQLILAAAGKPTCIVIADEMERSDMERLIKDNIDPPNNFRIVCRMADITDPYSLEKCSVETSRTIIISPTNDTRTVKAVLAVSALLQKKGREEISVNAIVASKRYSFPPTMIERHHITTLQAHETLAKMIAHSCTQTGLSETFREVFNYEGSELYLVDIPGTEGRSFEELMASIDNGVPAGILRDGHIQVNPDSKERLLPSDRLLVFSQESDSAVLTAVDEPDQWPSLALQELELCARHEDTVFFGYNESLPVILRELPENVSRVFLAGKPIGYQEKQDLQGVANARNLQLHDLTAEHLTEDHLIETARMAEHIVILNDHDKDDEAADLEVVFLLLNLRDIRARYSLHYNITAEMRAEHNQNLVAAEDHTDFVVASSMTSLFLAQLAESPELIEVFREILSNKGNELYLKDAASFHLFGVYSVRALRLMMLHCGYIFLGYLDGEKKSHFNPPLNGTVELRPGDNLIVLGES